MQSIPSRSNSTRPTPTPAAAGGSSGSPLRRFASYTSVMSPLAVSPAAAGDWAAACRMLFARRPAPDAGTLADRCRDMLAAGELDPAGLFAARDAVGGLRGAVLVQQMAGAVGLAWPPRVKDGPD